MNRVSMIRYFSAGGILINPKNQVYLIHKVPRDEWALPKGTIKENEDRLTTATREIKEETGYVNIEPVSEDVFDKDYYTMKHPKTEEEVDKTVYHFLFRLLDNRRMRTQEMGEEELEEEWFDFDRAIEKAIFNKTRHLLGKVKSIIVTKS